MQQKAKLQAGSKTFKPKNKEYETQITQKTPIEVTPKPQNPSTSIPSLPSSTAPPQAEESKSNVKVSLRKGSKEFSKLDKYSFLQLKKVDLKNYPFQTNPEIQKCTAYYTTFNSMMNYKEKIA
jgi:hypothetical protein